MNKIAWLALIIIVIGGFFARIYKIDNPIADWHSWRQADTASVTRIYVEKGIDLLHPKYHDLSQLQSGLPNPEGWRFVEFPLYNAIHALLVLQFPQYSLELLGRLLSVMFSLVSVVLIFLIGRKYYGNVGGIISSFAFAFLPYNVYFSRVILPEPAAVAFALASILLIILWSETDKKNYLYLSSVLFSTALLIKPYIIFYGLVILWVVLKKYNWEFIKAIKNVNLWLYLIIVVLPFGLWRIWITQYPEGIPYFRWAFNFMGIRFRPSFWRWIFGERLGDMILGIWGLVPFVFGLLAKNSVKEQWFAHVFILGMFLYTSIVAAGNIRHDYYQTLIIPAVCFVFARGILNLWYTRNLIQPLTKIVALFSVVLGFYLSFKDVKSFYQINKPDMVIAGIALDRIAPKDALVVAPYNGDTAFLYQTKRSGWPIQQLPIEDLVKMGAQYYVSLDKEEQGTSDAIKKFEIAVEEENFIIIDLSKKRMPK